MPLALAAVDLLAPNGELEVDWFAPLDTAAASARIDASLAEGYAKSDITRTEDVRNETAKAYAYYKEYKRIGTSIARKPKTLTVVEQNDTTSRTYTTEDAEFFLGLSASWWDVFVSLVPTVTENVEGSPSMSVKHRVRF